MRSLHHHSLLVPRAPIICKLLFYFLIDFFLFLNLDFSENREGGWFVYSDVINSGYVTRRLSPVDPKRSASFRFFFPFTLRREIAFVKAPDFRNSIN